MFQEIITGESKEMPARIIVYGREKIGKSRFAAEAPDAFFINVEGGLQYLGRKTRSTPKLESFDEVIETLKHIHDDEKFKCGTVVLDSADWIEELAQAKLIKMNGAKSITDPNVKAFAYFRGVVDAANECMRILTWLDKIKQKKNINAIIIAHSIVKEVDLPGKDPFSRNQLKLSKQLGSKLMEWCDLALYADYSFFVTPDGKTSEPKPVLFTGGDASHIGGGRLKLKAQLPLSYSALETEIANLK
jgi:hypothetical protein